VLSQAANFLVFCFPSKYFRSVFLGSLVNLGKSYSVSCPSVSRNFSGFQLVTQSLWKMDSFCHPFNWALSGSLSA